MHRTHVEKIGHNKIIFHLKAAANRARALEEGWN